MIYYQDEQIQIRDIVKEDVIYLFSWSIDGEINQFDPRPLPKNTEDLTNECIKFCQRFESLIVNEVGYKYFMITNHEEIPIGFVNLFNINQEKQNGEMGFCIGDKRYFRQGLATKAVKIALEYIFSRIKLKQVYIETSHDNIPAIKLSEKCGFQYQGDIMDEDCRFVVMVKHNTVKTFDY